MPVVANLKALVSNARLAFFVQERYLAKPEIFQWYLRPRAPGHHVLDNDS